MRGEVEDLVQLGFMQGWVFIFGKVGVIFIGGFSFLEEWGWVGLGVSFFWRLLEKFIVLVFIFDSTFGRVFGKNNRNDLELGVVIFFLRV